MTYFTKAFWAATTERVLATVAATLIGILTADGFDLLNADWEALLSAAGLAGLVSLLKAIVANAATKDGPSLLHVEQVVPPEPQPE